MSLLIALLCCHFFINKDITIAIKVTGKYIKTSGLVANAVAVINEDIKIPVSGLSLLIITAESIRKTAMEYINVKFVARPPQYIGNRLVMPANI